jgi:Fe-S oxidoreductase
LISGAIAEKAMYEKTFHEVIKKCANCGSCYAECPSNVNIPKLVMEARARYARRFGHPLADRIFTGVVSAGRTAGRMLELLRPLSGIRPVRTAGERITGFSARRDMVAFSPRSLFESMENTAGRGSPVVLYFAGCYSGYIRPEIGRAAVQVLKAMNMRVHLPAQHCCGLPMLSKGMTAEAGKKIGSNLAKWRHLLGTVDHIVVTCSSCGYALRQDWGYLETDAAVTEVRRKVIHISRLINKYAERLRLRGLNKSVSYHLPCHLKIQDHPECSMELLDRIPNLRVDNLDSHCCGMMGSWGLSSDNFDLSRRIGLDMVTRLDKADSDLGATDCPTCRMQMEQFGTKPIRHPIQILAASLAE